MEGARGLVGRRHVIEPPPRGFDRGTATQRVVVEMSHLGDLEWLHVSLGKGRATQKWNLEVIVVTGEWPGVA